MSVPGFLSQESCSSRLSPRLGANIWVTRAQGPWSGAKAPRAKSWMDLGLLIYLELLGKCSLFGVGGEQEVPGLATPSGRADLGEAPTAAPVDGLRLAHWWGRGFGARQPSVCHPRSRLRQVAYPIALTLSSAKWGDDSLPPWACCEDQPRHRVQRAPQMPGTHRATQYVSPRVSRSSYRPCSRRAWRPVGHCLLKTLYELRFVSVC